MTCLKYDEKSPSMNMSLLVKLKKQIVVLLTLSPTLNELHYKSNRTNKGEIKPLFHKV